MTRQPEIRDTLFGDAPMEAWPPSGGRAASSEPWRSFVEAREAVAAGKTDRAVALWRGIADTKGLETRHYAQAWHFLRAHGVQPPQAIAKRLLAVVLEVAMDEGLDLLAAYPERTARYCNFSGAGVIWERPSDALDAPIDALLTAGQKVLNEIGPWEQPRPAAPPAGQVRLNIVSPAGLHFGQAPFNAFMNDARAKPVMEAGIALMQAMIALQGK